MEYLSAKYMLSFLYKPAWNNPTFCGGVSLPCPEARASAKASVLLRFDERHPAACRPVTLKRVPRPLPGWEGFEMTGSSTPTPRKILLTDRDRTLFEHLSRTKIFQESDLKNSNLIGEKRLRTLIKEGYLQKITTGQGKFIVAGDIISDAYNIRQYDPMRMRHDAALSQIYLQKTQAEQESWVIDNGDRVNEKSCGIPDAVYRNTDNEVVAVEIFTKNYTKTIIQNKISYCNEKGLKLEGYRI